MNRSGRRLSLRLVSSSRNPTKDRTPRKKRKSALDMTTATFISESYVLIRNRRTSSSPKIAATAASRTPTRFRSCWIRFTIDRTPTSLVPALLELSTTGRSQKLGRAIRAHLGKAPAVRAELVKEERNEEAPPL